MHGGAKDFSKEASVNAKKRFFKSFLTLCCCHAEMLLFSISVSYCHSATLSLPSASTCFSISSFLSCWKTFSPELVSGLFQHLSTGKPLDPSQIQLRVTEKRVIPQSFPCESKWRRSVEP